MHAFAMASVDQFYDTVTKGTKCETLCCVKFCRKNRAGRHRLCNGHRIAKWRAENPKRASYQKLKCSASRRNIEFTLTFEQFDRLCESSNYHEQSGCTADALQIDRIDASLGYVEGNLQVLTTTENTAKGNRERWNEEYKRALLERKGYSFAEIAAIMNPEPDEDDPF